MFRMTLSLGSDMNADLAPPDVPGPAADSAFPPAVARLSLCYWSIFYMMGSSMIAAE